MITNRQGWAIWWKALKLSHYGSLNEAAEWMYKLNVLARAQGRHPITDEIYRLKNALIKHLYQCGYATEVSLHYQKRVCYSCDGTGEFWTGEECRKCDGTGVFAVTKLYGFRFCIDGRSYAWHQLAKLIDYPVTVTVEEAMPFVEPVRRVADLPTVEDAWLGCCIVWWAMARQGDMAPLLLFDHVLSGVRRWMGRLKTRVSKALDGLRTIDPEEDDYPF